MNKLVTTQAAVADAYRISLRACDLKEVSDWLHGCNPADLLASSIMSSEESFTASEGGTVVAIGGFSVQEQTVHPWLVASDKLPQYSKALLRMSRAYIERLRMELPYHLICNHVAKDNVPARLYLKALGATIMPSPGTGNFDFFFFIPTPCASTPYPSQH